MSYYLKCSKNKNKNCQRNKKIHVCNLFLSKIFSAYSINGETKGEEKVYSFSMRPGLTDDLKLPLLMSSPPHC